MKMNVFPRGLDTNFTFFCFIGSLKCTNSTYLTVLAILVSVRGMRKCRFDKNVKMKKVPTDLCSIVKVYSCDDKNKICMLGESRECMNHGISESDFIDDDSTEESSCN